MSLYFLLEALKIFRWPKRFSSLNPFLGISGFPRVLLLCIEHNVFYSIATILHNWKAACYSNGRFYFDTWQEAKQIVLVHCFTNSRKVKTWYEII